MRLAELKDPGPPSDETSEVGSLPDTQEGRQEGQEQFVTETTPSGLEILYSWAPKRLYRLRTWDGADMLREEPPWREVPSVTTVLGVLHKPALPWWGMKVGVEGVLDLVDKGHVSIEEWSTATAEHLVQLLTEHKLTVNHQLDKAADRGVNVHGALEAWCEHGILAQPAVFPETERGYIEGLNAFQGAIDHALGGVESEIMVGSLEHLYAGRFDLVLALDKPCEVVTRCFPKKPPKVEEIPAGRYLLDLKTSKRVYDTHFLQLEAYEKASVECGYEPTDYRGVVHVTADGKYELVLNKEWTFEDFAAVRQCYAVLNEREQIKNEREVEQALRDELGAKDAA